MQRLMKACSTSLQLPKTTCANIFLVGKTIVKSIFHMCICTAKTISLASPRQHSWRILSLMTGLNVLYLPLWAALVFVGHYILPSSTIFLHSIALTNLPTHGDAFTIHISLFCLVLVFLASFVNKWGASCKVVTYMYCPAESFDILVATQFQATHCFLSFICHFGAGDIGTLTS